MNDIRYNPVTVPEALNTVDTLVRLLDQVKAKGAPVAIDTFGGLAQDFKVSVRYHQDESAKIVISPLVWVFTYGTLKSDELRGDFIRAPRFNATLESTFEMHDTRNGFPALCGCDGTNKIHGELMQVTPSELHELDQIEGTEVNLFERRLARVHMGGTTESVYAWVYIGVAPGLFKDSVVIESGRWDGEKALPKVDKE